MTLVRNLLQRLSGNKTFLSFLLFLMMLSIATVNAQQASKHFKIALFAPLNFQNLSNENTIDQKSFEFSNLLW